MKRCASCLELKPRSEFYKDGRPNRDLQTRCKPCDTIRHRNWRVVNRERALQKERQFYKASGWAAHLRRKYGIDALQFKALLSIQHGGCGICGALEPGGNSHQFHVDHDHETGVIRGLLCSICNRMLGYAKDSSVILRAAAAYLDTARRKPSPSSKRSGKS